MRVLVLSGEVTHARPMSYGFPQQWETRVIELLDSEYLTLCEKYGTSKDVPAADTITFLRRAYDRALEQIELLDNLDVVVGIGYGAHVLMNLSTSCEWIGPSVYVMSEGNNRYNFVSRPLADEIDYTAKRGESIWVSISSLGDKQRRPVRVNYARKCAHEKNAIMQISLSSKDWQQRLCGTGLLELCTSIACNPSTHNSDNLASDLRNKI